MQPRLSLVEAPPADQPALVDGRQSAHAAAIQRGVGRLLRAHGFAMVTELTLASGRRADVVGLAADGEIWIVEIKSSIDDFRADTKWPDYRFSCDRLFFATRAEVPLDIFPQDAGLILADGYGGELVRSAPEHRLAGASRKAMLLRFAQAAALRLHGLIDPDAGADLL
ncbi:MAG: MmcB family DNA repair protein [Bauldia sp.]